MPKPKILAIIPDERIIGKIYFIRGKKVMLDSDLAELYGVETRMLNQAVKRNIKRFPDDFMFQLKKKEADLFLKYKDSDFKEDTSSRSQFVTLNRDNSLRSQNVILKRGQHLKYFPYVFTEQGVAMLSSVLKSDRAIEANIQIMRTFTNLREMLSTHKDLREKIEKMEQKYDQHFQIVFEAIKRLLEADSKDGEVKEIGFRDR